MLLFAIKCGVVCLIEGEDVILAIPARDESLLAQVQDGFEGRCNDGGQCFS